MTLSKQDSGLRIRRWMEGQVTKAISTVNGTISILDKQRAAATDKTVCLVQPTEHYPECIDK
jgi:hypothetical protein